MREGVTQDIINYQSQVGNANEAPKEDSSSISTNRFPRSEIILLPGELLLSPRIPFYHSFLQVAPSHCGRYRDSFSFLHPNPFVPILSLPDKSKFLVSRVYYVTLPFSHWTSRQISATRYQESEPTVNDTNG